MRKHSSRMSSSNQERKLGDRRRSDTVVVSTINYTDSGLVNVAFSTSSAPYEKSKSLGSGIILPTELNRMMVATIISIVQNRQCKAFKVRGRIIMIDRYTSVLILCHQIQLATNIRF